LVGLGRLVGVQALAVGLLQACGLREQPADLVPDGRVRLVHAQGLIPTHALEALPWNIHGAGTTVIGMAGIIGAPTIRIPALAADE
jgi:hypothetical protein